EKPAVEQNHHPVRDLLDLGQHMGGHQNGSLAGQLSYEIADGDDLAGIEPTGRLVENEQLRIVEQRLAYGDALPITPRQLPDWNLRHGLELETFRNGSNGESGGASEQPLEIRHELQVFVDPHVIVERRILRHIPDLMSQGEGFG